MINRLPHRYRVLILLFFLLFITYLDRVSIALVDKWIKSEFHLNNTQWGLIGGAFALSYALFEIPSGIWGDRIGQRATFIRIVLWWSLFTILTGFATGMADTSGFTLPVYILIMALIAGAFLWFAVDPSRPLVVNEKTESLSTELL